MKNLIVERRDKFLKDTDVVFLRITYRNVQEFFDKEDYLIDKSVEEIIGKLDKKFIEERASILWIDKLLYNPEYLNFSALVFEKNELVCFNYEFNKDTTKVNIINNDFKEYYKIINQHLNDYLHLIVPISIFTFSNRLLPLLFLNVIIKPKRCLIPINIKDIVIKLNLYFKDYSEKYFIEKIYNQTLKTAIISILIDSYAHNISAHSLSALKWWIELRHKMLDKRFIIKDNAELNCLQPSSIIFNKNKNDFECKNSSSTKIENTKDTTLKYYEALGLKDSTYNDEYYSLFDFLQFADKKTVEQLFQFSTPVKQKDADDFHPRFPVPIDYALFPFFRFLRDKGAFWSGVTRDMAFGGESKTWYQILWEDFANNPLYLGTIAKSEGITKLNINLEVKQNGKLLHKGRFVTIDLSVIDYEEKLSQDQNLDSSKCANLLQNDIKEDNECKTCKDFVDYGNYSKYAFVKLGKCFNEFRKILNNEENFRVFLPGGIVGEHALFTIFENTIRNIKHYKDPNILKDIQTNGIDFWISIEEDRLKITKQNENRAEEGKKPELFKVGVWLRHETELVRVEKKTEDGKEKEVERYLLFDITENTLKPILDESTGAPRMGGNSQDKACAALLFNNKFSSVENKGSIEYTNKREERDKAYFPWVKFTTKLYSIRSKNKIFELPQFEIINTKDKNFLIDKLIYVCELIAYTRTSREFKSSNYDPNFNFKEKFFKSLLELFGRKRVNNWSFRVTVINFRKKLHSYLSKKTKKEISLLLSKNGKLLRRYKKPITGKLIKSLYLWRAEDLFNIKNQSDFDGENISRFRFVIINKNDDSEKDLIHRARYEGAIRIILIPKQMKNNKINSLTKGIVNKNLSNLYLSWLKVWFLKEKLSVAFFKDSNPLSFIFFDSKKFGYTSAYEENSKKIKPLIKIPLSHGGGDENTSCNIRSHGAFWSKFFSDVDDKEPNFLYKNKKGEPFRFSVNKNYLLLELLEIIATRIIIFDNRIYKRFESFNKQKLNIFNQSLNLYVFEESLGKKKKINNKLDQIVNRTEFKEMPTIFIIHLTFIESLNYKENNIYMFIKDHLHKYIKKDNFILVITSGRGRDDWRQSLNNIIDEKIDLKSKVIFKPVESLLNAVETGISYNDNFDVKNNLIKVIFGS